MTSSNRASAPEISPSGKGQYNDFDDSKIGFRDGRILDAVGRSRQLWRHVLCHADRQRSNGWFRLWNVRGDREHPARLENCLGVYNKSAGGSGSSAGLWLCGVVEAERCTFHNNATAAIAIENNGPGGKLRAVNCILSNDSLSSDKPLVLKESGTNYDAVEVVQSSGGNPDNDPDFKSASPQWDGQPLDAFNSQRYGNTKGFWNANGVPKH